MIPGGASILRPELGALIEVSQKSYAAKYLDVNAERRVFREVERDAQDGTGLFERFPRCGGVRLSITGLPYPTPFFSGAGDYKPGFSKK